MINRYTLAALGVAFTLTGCAKHSVDETVGDFSNGATQLTVTHLDTRAADGTALFVTVDGQDAGALPLGEKVKLSVPAGKHQVGGYARSLIGRVTIAPIEITTNDEAIKNVAYSVTKSKPVFTVLNDTPVPKPKPVPVEAQPVVPPVPSISAEPTSSDTPAADATVTQSTAPAAADTTATQTTAPAAADTTATQNNAPAAADATATQTAEPATTESQATETEASGSQASTSQTTESQTTESQTTPANTSDSQATASQAAKSDSSESTESDAAADAPQS